MKPYFFFLSFLLYTANTRAQRSERYYDYQWRQVSVDRALFFSITEKEGARFHRRNYYMREDNLQMEGYYADSGCTIKQGDFIYYYPGGNIEIKSSYVDNRPDGRYLSFYTDGMMKDSFSYRGGNLTGFSLSLHPDGMMKDSIIRNEDGSGVAVSWHTNGRPSSAGYFAAGGRMRGTWQFFHLNGKPSAKELYDNGKLVNKTYFSENGRRQNDTTNTDRALSFPGSDNAWKKYAFKNTSIPAGWVLGKNDSIVVVISATIDEQGYVTEAFVSSPFHPAFDEIALTMLISSPRWIPAIEHHRKIKTPVLLPVIFASHD